MIAGVLIAYAVARGAFVALLPPDPDDPVAIVIRTAHEFGHVAWEVTDPDEQRRLIAHYGHEAAS